MKREEFLAGDNVWCAMEGYMAMPHTIWKAIYVAKSKSQPDYSDFTWHKVRWTEDGKKRTATVGIVHHTLRELSYELTRRAQREIGESVLDAILTVLRTREDKETIYELQEDEE